MGGYIWGVIAVGGEIGVGVGLGAAGKQAASQAVELV